MHKSKFGVLVQERVRYNNSKSDTKTTCRGTDFFRPIGICQDLRKIINPVSLSLTVEHFPEFVNGVDQAISCHGSQFLEGPHYAVEVCLDGRSGADIELLGPTDLLDGSEKSSTCQCLSLICSKLSAL